MTHGFKYRYPEIILCALSEKLSTITNNFRHISP